MHEHGQHGALFERSAEAAGEAERGEEEDAGVWERFDTSGGVYRGAADGRGVTMTNSLKQRAQEARSELESSILELLKQKPTGLRNSEIARELGLETDFQGRQKNYLTYSILGGLLARGEVRRREVAGKKLFFAS
jgi:hypothetical protein